MNKITKLKTEKNVSIFKIKNLTEHLANIFKSIKDKILISIINRFERNFV